MTPDRAAAFAELVPQLGPERTPPSMAELQAILDDEGVHLLVARTQAAAIAGAIVLVFYRVPTGLRARIEDLVVSRDHRGPGLCRALLLHTLGVARPQPAHVLELTSKPSRMAANRLYLALGFLRWETSVHRMVLDRPQGPPGAPECRSPHTRPFWYHREVAATEYPNPAVRWPVFC